MIQSGPAFRFFDLNFPNYNEQNGVRCSADYCILSSEQQVQTPNEEVPGWLRVCPIYPLHKTERPREMSQLHKQTRSLLDKKKEAKSKSGKENFRNKAERSSFSLSKENSHKKT